MKQLPVIPILSVPIAQVTYDEALDQMRSWIRARKTAPETVIAANVHVVTEAALNPQFREATLDASMVTPDGMPLVWASRLLGGKLRDRCYGPILMAKTLEAFQQDGVRHAFYGTRTETLGKLRVRIARQWPKAEIADMRAPPFGPFDDRVESANLAAINETKPDILWVAMGCPKQELWMRRYRHQADCNVILAVGAAFDFLAGMIPQAPTALQRLGLEWVFRLVAEPRRLWKRYIIRNPYFIFQFTLQLLKLRWR